MECTKIFAILISILYFVDGTSISDRTNGKGILSKILEDTTRLKSDLEIFQRLHELMTDAQKVTPSSDIINKLNPGTGFGKFQREHKNKKISVWIAKPVSEASVELVQTEKPISDSNKKDDIMKTVERNLLRDLKDGLNQGLTIKELMEDLKNVKWRE